LRSIAEKDWQLKFSFMFDIATVVVGRTAMKWDWKVTIDAQKKYVWGQEGGEGQEIDNQV
jgi:hypothetical protein